MWKRKRAQRKNYKTLHQLFLYLHTRPRAQLYKTRTPHYYTKRQNCWIIYMLHRDTTVTRARVRYHCLQSGRARGVNRAFRETRMETRHALMRNTLSFIRPCTK